MANVCQLFPITGNYQTLFQHQIKIQYNSPLLTKYLAFIPPITMDSKIQTTTFLKSSIRLAGFLRLIENLSLTLISRSFTRSISFVILWLNWDQLLAE